MTYAGIIKTYDPTTGTLKQTLTGSATSFKDAALSLKFSLGIAHGCLGGELVLAGDFRDNFLLDNGDVVKAFYSDADLTAGTAYYAGVIHGRERSLESMVHIYEISGLWQLCSGVAATVNNGVDETGVSNNPIGTIVAYLFNTYIGGVIANITDDDTDIVCDTVLEHYFIRSGDNICEHIEDLAMLAGPGYAYGIDGTGQFFFKDVSTDAGDLQVTAVVASTAVRAKETKDKQPRNSLAVVGGYNSSYGARAKETFTSGTGRKGRKLIANVRGLTKSADMTTYATNWFSRFNTANPQISDLQNLHLDATASPPLPWAGQFTFSDATVAYSVTDYVRKIDVDWADFFTYSLAIGLAGDDDDLSARSERNSAAFLDDEVGSADYESLSALPDVNDDITIPTDFPRGWTEEAINSKVAGGGGGTSTIGRGHVVHLWPIAPVLGETFHIYVAVDNGGTAFNDGVGEGVTFYVQHVNTAHSVSASSQAGVPISSSGSTELWRTNTGFSFSTEGYLRIAIATTTAVSPSPTYVWDPIDVSGGWPSLGATPGFANTMPAFPIVAPASTTAVTLSIVYAGWLGTGS